MFFFELKFIDEFLLSWILVLQRGKWYFRTKVTTQEPLTCDRMVFSSMAKLTWPKLSKSASLERWKKGLPCRKISLMRYSFVRHRKNRHKHGPKRVQQNRKNRFVYYLITHFNKNVWTFIHISLNFKFYYMIL